MAWQGGVMFHQASILPDPGSGCIPTRRVALLIDAENVPRDKVAAIIAATSSLGVATVRRAYGDWTIGALKGWSTTLHYHAIRPVQQFGYTPGKNASDIALVIDAMELLHAGGLDAFCIASSDADFTPLAMHLRASGRDVHGFGEAKTPRPFVTACTSFLALSAPTVQGPSPAVAAPAPPVPCAVRHDPRLVTLLRAAVKEAATADGWASMSAVGIVARRAGVDPKAHGCGTLTKLVAATGLFEFKANQAGHVTTRDRCYAAADQAT